MEKVTLFSASIDTQDIIKSAGDTEKALKKLRSAQRELNKEYNEQGSFTQEQAEQFAKNKAEISALSAESRNYQKVLQQLNDTNGEFLSVEESLSVALDREVNSIQGARDSNKELLAIRNELNLNSVEGAAAAEEINAALDQNNAFIKENVSAYEQQKIGIGDYKTAITGALNETTAFGGSFRQAQGAVQRFTPAIKLAKTELSSIATAYKASAAEAKGYTGAQKAAAVATNISSTALKLLRVALISTGIGAIIVAFGSLTAFLTSTQAGIDQVTKVTKPLQVIFSRLFGVVQELGASIFEAFSNPKQLLLDLVDLVKNQVINRFTALGEIIEGIINLDFKQVANGVAQAATGVEDVIGKVQKAGEGASEFLSESVKLGNELRAIGIEIEEQEAKIALQRAIANDEIKKQELIAKDSSRNAQERNEAAKEAARLLDEQITKEEEIIKLKIEELKLEQTLNDTSREEAKELNELEASLIAKGQERRSSELKFLSAQTAFRKEQQAAAEAARKAEEDAEKARIELIERGTKAEIDQLKATLELFELQNSQSSNLAQQINNEEEIRNRRLAIIDAEQKALTESAAFENLLEEEKTAKLLQFTIQRTKINQEFLEGSKERALESAENELQVIQASLKSRIDGERQITEVVKQAEKERIQSASSEAVSNLQEQYNQRLITEAQFQQQRLQIIQAAKDQESEIEEQFRLQEQAKEAENAANELEIRRLRGESELQLRREELDAQRELELAEAEKTGADLQLIRDKFAAQEEKIDQEVADNKAETNEQALSAVSNALKTLAGENKTLAIAAATIDGFLAAQKALASAPPPINFIAAATVGVATSQNISAIRRAERGISFQGTIKGNSHAQGGVNLGNGVEAEGGENMYTDGNKTYIVNKKASGLINKLGILGALSHINQKVGGGIPLTSLTNYAARGGQLTTSQNGVEVDYDKLGEAVARANSSLSFNVGVTEINEVNNNILEVEEFATV